MRLAVSTHWNTSGHTSGEAMIDEILQCGFRRVELGYDLRLDLVPGVRDRVKSGAVVVDSIHSFCPVPVGAPSGSPELFALAADDLRTRQSAIHHTTRSIHFAGEVGARWVVVHAGRVDMRHLTSRLIDFASAGRQFGWRYRRAMVKLLDRRAARVKRHLDFLERSIEELLPELDAAGVALAMENAPDWESLPSEPELLALVSRFHSPRVCGWYDTGHGQIRENLGLIHQAAWIGKLASAIGGLHLHDVVPPAMDHLMPPRGGVDFSLFKSVIRSGMPLVLEPAPGTAPEDVRTGARFLTELWGLDEA